VSLYRKELETFVIVCVVWNYFSNTDLLQWLHSKTPVEYKAKKFFGRLGKY
jgi:hypothetical protein